MSTLRKYVRDHRHGIEYIAWILAFMSVMASIATILQVAFG